MENIGMNLSWNNSESYLLLNPTYAKEEQERFQVILKAAHAWPAHVWLSTSGSSAQKWVGLSKQAVLASAQAVNQHLQSNKEDRWVNALPTFHVGGMGIYARAFLSGAQVYDFKLHHPGKWQAEAFHAYLEQMKGTLTALVPTQLYDLVTLGISPPTSLRAVIIGGGALLPSLYEQAIALGWPVLPSYGLTECASQVATASLESWRENQVPSLQLLSHMQACEREERLCFAGSSLLSVYAYVDGEEIRFVDPKMEGWLMSEDRGKVQEGQLMILGRTDAIIKVGGENVDLARLENLLQSLRLRLAIEAEAALIDMPDARLGLAVHLATSGVNQEQIAPLVDQFQQGVLPFERIRHVHVVSQLPRSSLGKILKNELRSLLSEMGK
jgi:O-succinylbenzoic acid--CoA ligase